MQHTQMSKVMHASITNPWRTVTSYSLIIKLHAGTSNTYCRCRKLPFAHSTPPLLLIADSPSLSTFTDSSIHAHKLAHSFLITEAPTHMRLEF